MISPADTEAREKNHHILVTGIHRSGTTFVGKMLTLAPGVRYVQEPFNPDLGMEGVDIWYPYVRQGLPCEKHYSDLVNRMLSGHARYRDRSSSGDGFLRMLGKKLFGSGDYLRYLASTRLPASRRLLIKDPLASLASEWLHQAFGMDVLILLRHPAGFAASTRRLGWDFAFSNLTSQAPLMKEFLEDILTPFDTPSMQPWQRAALLWRCIYSVLDVYASRNPEMRLIRLEDISACPEEQFSELYESMGLQFTEKSRRTIRSSTGSDNPVDVPKGTVHSLRRNSSGIANAWKNSFDANTLAEIRTLAGPPGEKYYGDDW